MSKLPYEGTSVSAGKSQGKIRDLLRSHGIEDIAVIEHGEGSVRIDFVQDGIPVRIPFSIHKLYERKRDMHPRTGEHKLMEQARREIWRHAYYYLKAIFDVLNTGIIAFTTAFFPYLTDGRQSLYQAMEGHLSEWYEEGELHISPALPAYEEDETDEICHNE